MQRLPLAWDYPKPPSDPKAAKAALVKARDDLQAAREENLASLKQWNEVHGKAINAETALTLLKAGNKIKAAEFGLKTATTAAAESARDRLDAEGRHLVETCAPFESAAARRLSAALAILEADAVASRIPDGRVRREECHALYTCVAHLGGTVTIAMGPVVRGHVVLGRLLSIYQQGKNEQNQPLINAILRAARRLHELLEEFRWRIGDTVCIIPSSMLRKRSPWPVSPCPIYPPTTTSAP